MRSGMCADSAWDSAWGIHKSSRFHLCTVVFSGKDFAASWDGQALACTIHSKLFIPLDVVRRSPGCIDLIACSVVLAPGI